MPEKEQELVPIDSGPPMSLLSGSPAQRITEATDVANALAPVITAKRLYATINRRQYVLYEGWTTLGALVGVFPRTTWTRRLDDGWEARVEAKTLNGEVVGAAEAQCTRAEKNWAARDDFALRSMAQTRAAGKALRMPLGFIMSLAGYEATPAEEMPRDAGEEAPYTPPEDESSPSGRWGCKECKTINDAENKKCFQCGRERGS